MAGRSCLASPCWAAPNSWSPCRWRNLKAMPGRCIGIVDDDSELRDSLALVLRFRNFEVLEFASGEDLLATPALDKLDCMILDLRMPGSGGLEVLEACRARRVTAPIIVVTAFGNVASATHALKLGAFDFLEK